MDHWMEFNEIQDNYIFCPLCPTYVFEYCAIHGPPLIIPDTEVSKSPLPRTLPPAALTIPDDFLHYGVSTIPDAGVGVFSSTGIPAHVRFGPYGGVRTQQVTSMYCWKVHLGNSNSYIIDAQDENYSNWMRYVNCSRHVGEQNLVAYQQRGQIYFRTIKPISCKTELLVFYGSEFAKLLDIDLRKYNRRDFYDEVTNAQRKPIRNNLSPVSYQPKNLIQQEAVQCVQETVIQDNNNIEIHPDPKNIEEPNNDSCNKNENISLSDITGQAKVNSKIVNSPLKYPPRLNSESLRKLLTCDTCNKLFKSMVDLTRHILGLPLHSCSNCSYKTHYSSNLKRHVNAIHKKEITYNCPNCSYKTYYKSNLEIHINNMHTKETSYSCSHCSYKTYYKSNLEIHINNMHTKETSYSCSHCSYKTYCKSNLKTHINTIHTKETSYSCSHCSFKTYHKSCLKKHVNAIHKKKTSYSCSKENEITS